MSRPLTYLHQELPGYVLQRQSWIREIEENSRDEDQASMEMLIYFMVLGIVTTFCVLAWVLW